MNNLLKFMIVLLVVNCIAASILTGVYFITKPKIEEQERFSREEALGKVMPESVGDRIEPIKENGDIKYWEVFKGNNRKVRGYIFIAKKYGYSSIIETMVGMKKDGIITGVRVLSQNETPGLGAKILEVTTDKTLFSSIKDIFSKKEQKEEEAEPYFTAQLKNLNVKDIKLNKYGIDAITGATISSKALVDSIREQGTEILK